MSQRDEGTSATRAGNWRLITVGVSRRILILLCVVAVAAYLLVPGSRSVAATTPPPSVTPADSASLGLITPPTDMTLTGGTLPLSKLRVISVARDADDSVVREAERLAGELTSLGVATPSLGHDVTAEAIQLKLDSGMVTDRDSVRLEVSEASVTVTAGDATGLFRGTRALLQLAQAAGIEAVPTGEFLFENASRVRSVHLDIARKHYPPEVIREFIREAAWSGFNQFELHFNEFEGFGIESDSHPEIVSKEALTKREVKDLIEFAADLHVQVTPSLDMPGHLEHVLEAHPEFRLHAASGEEVFGALDITNPAAVDFLKELIAEYADLFEAGTWNIGADEFLDFDSSDESAALTTYASERFGPNANAFDTLTAFVNDMSETLRKHGFTTRVWNDGMLRGNTEQPNPEVEIAYWSTRPPGVATVDAFARDGHPVINVNDEYLYFVLGERVGYAYPQGEPILNGWSPFVFPSLDGAAQTVPADLRKQVSGGMFAIWSDIPDALTAEEVLAKARPALRAMAARLAVPDADLDWATFRQVAATETSGPAEASLPETWRQDASVAESAQPSASDVSGNATSLASWLPSLLCPVGGAIVAVVIGTLLLRRRNAPTDD